VRRRGRIARWRWPILAGAAVAVDQLTKWLAGVHLAAGRSVPIAEPLLSLRLIHNRGIAFGLLSSMIAPLTLLAVMAILYFTRRVGRDIGFRGPGGLGVALLLGGAIGNLIDRVRLGYVIDFIDVWRWPTFNAADVCITAGCVILAAMYACHRSEPRAEHVDV
jgi:signal peptidase II